MCHKTRPVSTRQHLREGRACEPPPRHVCERFQPPRPPPAAPKSTPHSSARPRPGRGQALTGSVSGSFHFSKAGSVPPPAASHRRHQTAVLTGTAVRPGGPRLHTHAVPTAENSAPLCAEAHAVAPWPVMDVWTVSNEGLLWALPPGPLSAVFVWTHVPAARGAGLRLETPAGRRGRPPCRWLEGSPRPPRVWPPGFPTSHVRGSRALRLGAAGRAALSCEPGRRVCHGSSLWPDLHRPRR